MRANERFEVLREFPNISCHHYNNPTLKFAAVSGFPDPNTPTVRFTKARSQTLFILRRAA